MTSKTLPLFLIIGVAVAITMLPSYLYAQAFPPGVAGTPPVTTPTPGAGSASCDFTAIKDSLGQTESGGNYAAICRQNGVECAGGARGKYQFIRSTRSAYIGNNPQCNGGACDSDEAWITPACHGVQECIMDAYLAESLDRVRNEPACQTLLNSGATYSGNYRGQTLSCPATESGLLGAMHLGGNGGGVVCGRILNGTGPSDQLGTSVTGYMCHHGGLAVPNACIPGAYDPNISQPVGTQTQVTAWTGLGISVDPYGGPPDPLKHWWVFGLQMMAEQFTATMIWQVEAVGMLLDAKHQLETQRLFQQKTAEAHRDYQPSEQMCTFGTFAMDLAATQRSADLSKQALNQELLQRELGSGESMGKTPASDSLSRIKRFRDKFCNPKDNGNGLAQICPTAAPAATQNADINYTSSVDQKLSLDIDMTDNVTTDDEEIIFALVDNLFVHDAMPRINENLMLKEKFQYQYSNYRSLIAMRGIARNSIANIVAMKTQTPYGASDGSAPYLKSLMTEFGLSDGDIETLLGENPSYYAQMEMLTKKMYQNPNFYTNLMDKPANVKRIRAAMQAIKLMQDRDIATALQRREMLLSMMLELRLRERADKVYNTAEQSMFEQN